MSLAVAPGLTTPDVTPETSVADRFRAVAAARPDALALTTSTARYTYAEIDRWSDAVAADLVSSGAPPERPVAVFTRDNVLLVPAGLGAVKAGYYVVTVDASDPEDRIALILRESKAALCLVEPGRHVPAAVGNLPVVAIRNMPSGPVPPVEREPNPWVIVNFTSGTTGTPKAIRTPHHNYVVRTLRQDPDRGRAPGERRNWTAVPGYTRAASAMFQSLLTGVTLCAFDARRESLDAFATYVVRERLTQMGMTPSFFRRFMAVAPADLDLSSIKSLRLNADKVTPADVEIFKTRFPRTCNLQVGYAATETGFVFRMTITHDTPIPGPLVPLGKPTAEVEVRIVDEDGNPVADGEVGELEVRGRWVIEGYWNDPELSAQKFRVEDPAHPEIRTVRTGDLVRRDADGNYYFIGRGDARMKIHGRRIDPTEVEGALIGTGLVREAVVVGKPDPNGETRAVAYVVTGDGEPFDARAIRARMRETHPVWMLPSRIYQVESIPMTRALKVDRAALAAKVDPSDTEDSGAADDLERRLTAIWSRVVGTPVHVDDDFFDDLGGESVVAAHLATEVQRETGTPVPMSLLLELSTVGRMAEYLRGTTVADRLAVLVQPGGPLAPIFCVTGKDGSVIKFRKLAAAIGTARPFYGLTFHGFDLHAFPTSVSTIAACYAQSVRKVQPSGPYYLAGYSGGARMALEVARILRRQGEQVAFLGLLDAAGAPQSASMWRRIINRIDIVRQLPRGRVREFLKEAATRPVSIARRRVHAILVQRGLAFPRPVRAANKAHKEARKDFSSQPYNGPVTLFRARNGQGLLGTEPDLGWSKAGVTRLEIHDVRGDHNTMLTDEVASLSRVFQSAVEAAETQAAESAQGT